MHRARNYEVNKEGGQNLFPSTQSAFGRKRREISSNTKITMASHTVTLFSAANQQSIELVAASVVTIGRGFFQCEDKRVSRQHGTITVAETAISVKSCHTNPIFYKLNDQPQTKILTKDTEVTLKHKDKFSLLPNEFEYEVRVIEQANEASMDHIINETASAVTSASTGYTSAGSSSADARKRSHEGGQAAVDAKRLKSSNEQAGSSSNDPAGIVPVAPIIKPDPDQPPSEPSANVPQQVQPVRIKPEPLSQPADAAVANTSSNAAAAVANLTANTSSNAAATIPDAKVKPDPEQPAQPAPVAPNPIRPSCNYGIRCYINTADHRRDHAHPVDADYRRPVYPDPPSGTPACPFAANCYRRNPEHFMRLSHPPASQYIANQPRPAAQNIARQPQPAAQRIARQAPLIFVQLGYDGDGDDDDEAEHEDFDDSMVKTHLCC